MNILSMKYNICICIIIFCLLGCSRQPEEGEYPPLIYVNDTLYIEENYVKSFSDEWVLLGEIQKIKKNERPKQNYVSNTLEVGTDIYADEKGRIWIEISKGQNKGKYICYHICHSTN